MKKKNLFGVMTLIVGVVLVFGLAGCGDNGDPSSPPGGNGGNGGGGDLPTTNGKFTLTGAGSYNGQYAYAQGTVSTGFIYGGTGKSTEWKGVLIQNGTVELPMYFKSTTAAQLTAYSGGDTINSETIGGIKMYKFQVWIMSTADVDSNNLGSVGTHYIGWDTVTFSSGSVTKAVSEGTYY